MKRIFVICFLIAISTLGSDAKDKKQYLFDEFKEGVIVFTNGTSLQVKINYNILYSQIIYIDQNNSYKALSNSDIQRIETIKVASRTFIPFKQGVVELLETDPFLSVQYNSIRSRSKTKIGFGATSETTASSNISELYIDGVNPDNKSLILLPEVNIRFTYYVKKGQHTYPVRSIKQLKKIFPSKKIEIESYLRKNKNLNFKKTADIKLFYKTIMKLNEE